MEELEKELKEHFPNCYVSVEKVCDDDYFMYVKIKGYINNEIRGISRMYDFHSTNLSQIVVRSMICREMVLMWDREH